MIEILSYHSNHEKNQFIAAQNLENTTLLVSDLDSKLHWQKVLLNKNGFLAGAPILRAEDFWKLLVQRNFPQIHFVSRSWVSSYVKELLDTRFGEDFGLPFAKTSTTLKALNEFLPIVCHPDTQEVMQNWWEDSEKRKVTWKSWFLLSQRLWNEIFQTKCLLSDWSAHFLINNNSFSYLGEGDLLVDLGSELRPMEVELLQSISTKYRVKVLMPAWEKMEAYPWVGFSYKQFLNRSHAIKDLTIESKNKNYFLSKKDNQLEIPPEFKRFTSCLSEIKFAVGQIRQWLKEGTPLSQMAIIAPDIEFYWPVLSWHLKKDHIPFERVERLKVGGLGPILAWIAKLKKIYFSDVTFVQHELAEFHPNNLQTLNYLQELSKWSKKNKISNAIDLQNENNKISASTFLKKAYSIYLKNHKEGFDPSIVEILKKWLMEAEKLGNRQVPEWIEYLENFLHHQEMGNQNSSRESLGIYSLLSGIPNERIKQIYFGCSESQLKSNQGIVSGAEVLSLLHHTGHLLPHPDRDFREFQLKILQRKTCEQIYTFAESDFNGTELVPSVFWLQGREMRGEKLNQGNSWTPSIWEQAQLAKKRESLKNAIELNSLKEPFHWDFSLSPSSLKSYVECPFKFFAEKGLKLADPELVDLDLDPRTQGSIQHQLLEKLITEPFNAEERREKLPEIIEDIIKQESDHFYSEKTAQLTKQFLYQLGLRFLEKESVYRKQFPKFFTMACEAWYRRDLEVDGNKIKFRGKIDRIDLSTDHSSAIVIDYKNDLSQYRNANSWMQNLEFQMPSYVSSLEGGFVSTTVGEGKSSKPLPATPVVAAHYYGLKDFKRKGFTLDSVDPGVVVTPTSNSTITSEEKEKLIQELEEVLINSSRKILTGDFSAIPHPKTDCNKCAWRHICRTKTPNL